MSDDRVIHYLRMRARVEVEPEPDLVSGIMAAVDEAPSGRSPIAAFLPSVAVAGAVAIMIALALVLGQGPEVGPNPTGSLEAPPSPASVDEMKAAIELGIEQLRASPGVEGIATASVIGELSSATWFTLRPNGDQVVISRSDVDVSETGWWLEPGAQPRARRENITTTIHVLVGDGYFVADDETWDTQSRAGAPAILSLATGILDDETLVIEGIVGNLAGEATVARSSDGATTWTVTAPDRDGSAVSAWQLAADGTLVSWSIERVGVTPTPDDGTFLTHQSVEFMALQDPRPIEAPDADAPPDPAALGLPPDFPLGGDGEAGAALAITELDLEPKPGFVEDGSGLTSGPVINQGRQWLRKRRGVRDHGVPRRRTRWSLHVAVDDPAGRRQLWSGTRRGSARVRAFRQHRAERAAKRRVEDGRDGGP